MFLADLAACRSSPDDVRLALHAALSGYHAHEWVWGDWLKGDAAVRATLSLTTGGFVKDLNDFLSWIDLKFPEFKTLQALANGTKHFNRKEPASRVDDGEFDTRGFDVGGFNAPCLLVEGIDGAQRPFMELLVEAEAFWRFLFTKHPGGPL